MDDELTIADIVRTLRTSILDLHRERQQSGQTPLWKISDCEIELNVIARQAKNVDGKIAAAIFATSAGRAYAAEQVHKIKLRLTPFPPVDASAEQESIDTPAFLRKPMN